MTNFEFVTAKLVPNLFRNEPINVGIMILDKNNKMVHTKFTRNFDELLKRIGYEALNGIDKMFNFEQEFDVSSNEFFKELTNGPEDSLTFTKPISIKVERVQDSLNKIYKDMISIPSITESEIDEIAHKKRYSEKIKNRIKFLRFPINSVKERQEILGITHTRKFPFVFYKNDRIKNMLDIISLNYAMPSYLINQVKAKSWDFYEILKSNLYPDVKITAFTPQKQNQINLEDPSVKIVKKLLKSNKVELKFADDTDEYLDKLYAQIVG